MNMLAGWFFWCPRTVEAHAGSAEARRLNLWNFVIMDQTCEVLSAIRVSFVTHVYGG